MSVLGCEGRVDFRRGFARTIHRFHIMTSSSLFWLAAVAACLALGACGGKPSPKPDQGGAPSPRPETIAPAVQVPDTASVVESARARIPAPPKPETLPDAVRRTFPTAGSARSVSKPFPHRVVRDTSGRVLGYEVFSDSAGVTGRGYMGMVPVQVFLDAQAKPVRIYVLDNSETPGYLDIVFSGELLERLLRYDPARPDSVDAVTLATSSSKAIIAGVTGLAARVSAEIVAKSQRGQ
jgi:uncharacterized protein with FMN-binding domain